MARKGIHICYRHKAVRLHQANDAEFVDQILKRKNNEQNNWVTICCCNHQVGTWVIPTVSNCSYRRCSIMYWSSCPLSVETIHLPNKNRINQFTFALAVTLISLLAYF